MRKQFNLFELLAIVVLALYSQVLNASTTTVTATIQDPSGQVFANGAVTAEFVPAANYSSGSYTSGGVSFPKTVTGTLNSAGTFVINVTDSLSVAPALTTWRFTVCPNATSPCTNYFAPIGTVTGGAINLSSQINAEVRNIIVQVSPNYVPAAYKDSEIISPPAGAAYWNLSIKCIKVFDSATGLWTCSQISSSIQIANNYLGDWGTQVNSADATLGSNCGEIWLFGGGATATQGSVSSCHKLHMFPGLYTNSLGLRLPVIRLNDNSSLEGENLLTIIQESSNAANTSPVIVCAADLGVQCTSLAVSTSNIHVSGVRFQGANPNSGTSLIDSVSLGNCIGCSVNNNSFDNIASSHILIGGTSGSSFWAKGFEVAGNLFTGSANCSVCIINGEDISVHDNFWSLHGNGAAADIDVEPNSTTDHAQNIDLHDNIFNESLAINSVYCVTIQNGPFVAMGRIKVHDNICDGGPYTTFGAPGATGTFKLITCFGVGPGPVNSFVDMEVYNNFCRVTVQGGIGLVGVNRGSVHDNILECINDYAVVLDGSVTNSTVERNRVLSITSPTSCGQNPAGVYKTTVVAERNSNNDNNIFRDNIATATVILGPNSKNVSNTLIDGSGQSFHVPVGLNAGASGGVQLVALGAPVLFSGSVPNFASGVCVLAANQYFYKVRAVSAAGGMGVPSNEVTFNSGGGFGCLAIKWTKIAGAKSYNIYRSLASGAEQLIDSVSDGSTYYADFGGQVPSTAIDNNDTSIEIAGVESKPPAGVAAAGILWPDSTLHCWEFNSNNGGNSGCIPGVDIAQTWTGTQTFNLIASPLIVGTNAATSGAIRLSNAQGISTRNNANTNNLALINTDTSDRGVLPLDMVFGTRVVSMAGQASAGNVGVAQVIGTIHATGQTASIGTTTIVTPVPAAQSDVCFYAETTTAGTGTTATVTIGWTDLGGAKTFTSGTFALNSVGNTGFVNGCQAIFAQSATNITYAVTVGAIGTSVYAVDVSVKKTN